MPWSASELGYTRADGHQRTDQIRNGWADKGAPSADIGFKMQITPRQRDMSGLEQVFLDVSNPNSSNYRKWLSKEELETYTSPSTETVQAVTTWLTSSGISADSVTQTSPDWLEVPTSVTKRRLS
jgi:tripeptidyl-peptidase-1